MDTDIVQIYKKNSTPLLPVPTGISPGLSPLPRIRAVAFDVYGTLFISESGDRSKLNGDNFRLFSRVLEHAGLTPATSAAGREAGRLFLEAIDTSHERDRTAGIEFPEVEIRDIWRRVLVRLNETGFISSPPADTSPSLCAAYYEVLSNPVYPMPRLSSTLDGLRDRGITLCIVSNAQFYTPELFPAFLGTGLEETGFDPGLCVWSYLLGRAKPDRLLYRDLSGRLSVHGITPGETLYIGNDMLNDVYPAAQEGFRTALFAGDRRSLRLREKELCSKNVKSDIIITDLSQLLEIIQYPNVGVNHET